MYRGCSADTPTLAVDNIAQGGATERLERFPNSTPWMIEADRGGSHSASSRVWKQPLQDKVADRFGLTITVCQYPTGASKWNPVEHRLFSEISKTWAGCPWRTFDIAAQYIGETTTQTGLKGVAHLITHEYTTGVTVSDAVMETLNLTRHAVCPHWNYTIRPRANPLPNS